MFRYLLCLLGVLLALPLLTVIALAFTLPVSMSGIGYLLAGSLIVTGLILARGNKKYSSLIAMTGVIAFIMIAGARLILARQNGSSRLTVVNLPKGNETRWINTSIDEQDNLIFGEALFHFLGGDSSREHNGLAAALHSSYTDIRKTRRVFPSPVLSTYLNLQRPRSFDAVMIEPEVPRHQKTAVIFLHGYMGNVTAQCWEIAKGAGNFGARTVCPSTDWTGQWWHPEGQAILQATFQYLREQGIENFYLGGFSNGGFGVSRLVSEVSKQEGLSGLFFIDGITDGESIRETGLPVLIIQAAQDERVPVENVRQIAEVIGDLGTYVELDGDHFIIIKRSEPVQAAITDWLEEQASGR
ncbi:MAG TPA: alpha/beta hydrolase [Anaerolineales bacterium]|nr:alpha/beta hydrolase [Anaerolineales bacterium]